MTPPYSSASRELPAPGFCFRDCDTRGILVLDTFAESRRSIPTNSPISVRTEKYHREWFEASLLAAKPAGWSVIPGCPAAAGAFGNAVDLTGPCRAFGAAGARKAIRPPGRFRERFAALVGQSRRTRDALLDLPVPSQTRLDRARQAVEGRGQPPPVRRPVATRAGQRTGQLRFGDTDLRERVRIAYFPSKRTQSTRESEHFVEINVYIRG